MFDSIPIKTLEEFEIMREGAKVLKNVLDVELPKIIRVGISTYEIDRIAEEVIRSYAGATPGFKGYNGFPATVCASINNEVVHGIPSKKRILKDGDIIGIDCGVLFKGMNTDACRTFMIGDVDYEVRHFVKTTKKALEQSIKQVIPGNHIGDISAVIQKVLMDQNYAPVIDCTGHGVGRNLHEAPEILNVGQKGTGPIIKAGMAFAIEPISTLGTGEVITGPDGWTIVSKDNTLSAHFEHTVLVTENGPEIIV